MIFETKKVNPIGQQTNQPRRVAGQAERAAKSPQAHPTSAALYSIWRKADLDGNGYLSEAEIKALNSALKTSWSFEDLWKDGLDMYEGEDTTRLFRYGQGGLREIGFGAFVQKDLFTRINLRLCLG